MNVNKGLAVLITSALMSCASSNSQRCDVSDIREVFASPAQFQGQWFCGEGFLFADEEWVGIYDRAVSSPTERAEVAMLLDARTARGGVPDVPRRVNVRVFVRGQLDPQCLDEPCVPIARPIWLNYSEVRIVE